MCDKVILLPIHKVHADKILVGSKTEEYRTVQLSEPIRTIMYVSSEKGGSSKKVRKIVGEFMMGPVCGTATKLPGRKADYFPLCVSKVVKYREEIPWIRVRERIPDVRKIPMMFTYLRPPKVPADSKLLEMLEPLRREGAKVTWE